MKQFNAIFLFFITSMSVFSIFAHNPNSPPGTLLSSPTKNAQTLHKMHATRNTDVVLTEKVPFSLTKISQ